MPVRLSVKIPFHMGRSAAKRSTCCTFCTAASKIYVNQVKLKSRGVQVVMEDLKGQNYKINN